MAALLLSARLVLGAVFLMSSLPKLAAPRRFAADILNYRILPRPLALPYAWSLPVAELAAAVSLLTGFYARPAGVVAAIMLGSFMVAVGVVMARGESLTCSCFGLLYRERVGWSTQVRDAFLLLMALYVALGDDGSLTVAHLAAHAGQWEYAAWLALSVAATTFGLVVAALSIRIARRQPASRLDGAPLCLVVT